MNNTMNENRNRNTRENITPQTSVDEVYINNTPYVVDALYEFSIPSSQSKTKPSFQIQKNKSNSKASITKEKQ